MWQGDVTIGQSFLISVVGMVVVMLELIFLALFITVLSKAIRAFEKKKSVAPDELNTAAVPEITVPSAGEKASQINSESDGNIEINGASAEETAIIMSVISAESGIELDKLGFKSINKID